MIERWLPINDFVGYYEVSDTGRVRSLPRMVGGYKGDRSLQGRILRGGHDRNGRPQVQLWRDNTYHPRLVHTLVLAAFVGERPPGLHGCHNDGNNENNHVSNLRWDTPAENMHDKVRHGTNPYLNRTHCPFGHLLRMPNLVRDRWEKDGERACRACALARGACYRAKVRGVSKDFLVEVAARYAWIMAGEVQP